MAERTPERLARLLGLVAYLDRHPGVTVEEVAGHFGVSGEQVLRDVDTLWVSGTPGYWPDDLIDFDATSLESGVLHLTRTRGLGGPLRLGTREAVTLLAALRALDEALGPALGAQERDVLTSTVAALTAATGDAAGTMDVHLALEAPQVLATVRQALAAGRRLRLRYVNASDVTSEREVDPWQVLTGDDHTYLQAWCATARAERLFRLDRVLEVEQLDEPVTSSPAKAPAPFRPSEDLRAVSLVLDGSARWVAEQLPVEHVREQDHGRFEVELRWSSDAWLQHLLLVLATHVREVRPAGPAVHAADAARRALAAYERPDH